MSYSYEFNEIEDRARNLWKNRSLKKSADFSRQKYFILDKFPTPTNYGLHVGNFRSLTISDVWSRYKKIQGFDIFHPLGWNSFAKEIEQDARRKGININYSLQQNINSFKNDLKQAGILYQTEGEPPSLPCQYNLMQFLFLKMYEKGLLYKVGEWMARISEYRDRLINDLDKLNWPENIKKIQRNLLSEKEQDLVLSHDDLWGVPIPIINCDNCGQIPASPGDFQVPDVDQPEAEHNLGVAPRHAQIIFVKNEYPGDKWSNGDNKLKEIICPKCKERASEETKRIKFSGEILLFIRNVDHKNENKILQSEGVEKLIQVDHYFVGVEHTAHHLLYLRFITKFLFDIGLLPFDEPISEITGIGMVCKMNMENKKLEKMSKSKGNVIPVSELINNYGADALRLHVLFLAPPTSDFEWDETNLEGILRFLNRTYRIVVENIENLVPEPDIRIKRRLNKLIKDVSQKMEELHFNTIISSFMDFINFLKDRENYRGEFGKETLLPFIIMLAPFAPHICEEFYSILESEKSIFDCNWPSYDPAYLCEEMVRIVIQIDGKFKTIIEVPVDSDEDSIRIFALKHHGLMEDLAGKKIIKTIYVRDRLLNLVTI